MKRTVAILSITTLVLGMSSAYAFAGGRGGHGRGGPGRDHLGKRMHRAVRYTPKQVEALLATRTDKIVSEVDDKGSSITDLSGVLASYQEYSMGEGGFNENLD